MSMSSPGNHTYPNNKRRRVDSARVGRPMNSSPFPPCHVRLQNTDLNRRGSCAAAHRKHSLSDMQFINPVRPHANTLAGSSARILNGCRVYRYNFTPVSI